MNQHEKDIRLWEDDITYKSGTSRAEIFADGAEYGRKDLARQVLALYRHHPAYDSGNEKQIRALCQAALGVDDGE